MIGGSMNCMRSHPKRVARPVFAGWKGAARGCFGQRSGVSRGVLAGGMLSVAMLAVSVAQEVPRPSIARQKVQQSLPTISNLRVGQVLLRVDAGLSTEFVDNVNLSSVRSADVIITPRVGVTATWAVTRQNTLQFRTSLGYVKYLNNPSLDQQILTIAPDSALSFDIYSGDFKINFHDSFSLQQNPIGQSGVSGVAQLGQFTNTIGVNVLWDMNDVIWTLGYDHYNLAITGSAVSTAGSLSTDTARLDHSTDQISTSARFTVSPVAMVGIEATAAASTYPKNSTADFESLTVGPFMEWQLTQYTHLFFGAGLKVYSGIGGTPTVIPGNPGLSQPAQEGSDSGYYANLSVVHTLNRFYRDRLEIGRSDDVDAFNGRAVINYIRYSSEWRINPYFTLASGLSYEAVEQSTGGLLFNVGPQDYTRMVFSMGTGYQLTEHVDVSVGYRYTRNTSNLSSFNFSQNSLTISLGYRF